MPATHRVERPLHFAESEADQLCILGVHLKNYTLAGMPLCLWSLECIYIVYIMYIVYYATPPVGPNARCDILLNTAK